MMPPGNSWRTDPVTGRHYRLTAVKTSELRNSRFNPRLLKREHVDDLKASMQLEGQYVPITCVEIEPTPEGQLYDVLDGKHRFQAALELSVEEMDAKVYAPDLSEADQKRMAIYLNQGVKKINAGEFFRSAEQFFDLTADQLKQRGAKVINEARVIEEARIQGKADTMRYTIGRIVHRLQQDSEAAIREYISDAQTPKNAIVGGQKTVLTAQNLAGLLRELCREEPVGPWEPHKAGLTPSDYEAKLLKGEIAREPDKRAAEYENARRLTDLLVKEVIAPRLDTGNYDEVMNLCRHHVLRGLGPVLHQVLIRSGSSLPSAPLYVDEGEINWDQVKPYMQKLKTVLWLDPVFMVRVPQRITDYLWRQVL